MAQANIKAVITAEDRASAVLTKFGTHAEGVSNSLKSAVNKTSRVLIAATTAAVTFAVKSASEFEQSRIAFDTMLGSAEAGKKIMKDLSDFARKTPFELPDVVEGAKKLLAYGISAEDVMKDLKTLGDISAGVGKDKLPQLTLAFGQVATKGKLFGQEIRQFTEAGIPLIDELSKSLGVTKERVVEMSENGEIGFAQVRKALENMTGEGGKFFKLMDRQSKSFGGVVSNIKDNIGRLARSIVGISDEGEIREGSIFARLRDAAMKLLKYLDDNQGNITAAVQGFVDKMLRGGEDFTKRFISQVKSDGFASALSQSFMELIGKLDWEGMATKAVGLFIIIAPQIVKGFLKGLVEAATQNPLNFTLLFLALGFAPAGVIAALATVLSGIPIVGPILGWVIRGFAAAASAALAPVSALFRSLGTSAVSSLAGGMTASAGLVAAAGAIIIFEFWKITDALKKAVDAWNGALNAGASASISDDFAIRKIQSSNLSPDKKAAAIRSFTARASGGPVADGSPYVVGEQGPELFVPNQSGTIIPNNKMGGGTVNFNVSVGVYAGSEMEKRKIASQLFASLQDVASSRGQTVSQMMGS